MGASAESTGTKAAGAGQQQRQPDSKHTAPQARPQAPPSTPEQVQDDGGEEEEGEEGDDAGEGQTQQLRRVAQPQLKSYRAVMKQRRRREAVKRLMPKDSATQE